MMFRCEKCEKTIDGAPEMQPKGYKRDDEGTVTGNRMGEALLCKKCALSFRGTEGKIIEYQGGFRYAFFG